jgi:1-acyl-sn-glycerol-3-phosphate acyltransferase
MHSLDASNTLCSAPFQTMMAVLRALTHLLWMALTVVPYTLAIMLGSLLGVRRAILYRIAAAWLSLSVRAAGVILGIQTRITGMENLPQGQKCPAVLLVKHQSTFETFLMPAIMPHPLAYVFKKELLQVPFFGWSIGRLDMIHIDRSLRAQSFKRVVAQGKERLEQGIWIIMFPEGTRTERGQKGVYETSGTRLAVQTGAPVIPIAVASGKCWPRRAFLKTPGIVDVSIGKPIASQGRHHKELMQEVEDWIEAEMRRLDPQAYR